jgi:hypothetical protein
LYQHSAVLHRVQATPVGLPSTGQMCSCPLPDRPFGGIRLWQYREHQALMERNRTRAVEVHTETTHCCTNTLLYSTGYMQPRLQLHVEQTRHNLVTLKLQERGSRSCSLLAWEEGGGGAKILSSRHKAILQSEHGGAYITPLGCGWPRLQGQVLLWLRWCSTSPLVKGIACPAVHVHIYTIP